MIGKALVDERTRRFRVPAGARELVDRVTVRRQPEPVEAIKDRLDRGIGRALAVGILNTEQHLAAGMAGIEPVEEGGARSADMQVAGRGRRKPRDNR